MNNINISLSKTQSLNNFQQPLSEGTPLFSWAILGLAFFFTGSHLAIGVADFLNLPPLLSYAIPLISVFPLWWRKYKKPSYIVKNQFLYFVIIAISVFSCFSSLNAIDSSDFGVAAKTIGVIIFLLTILVCAPSYQLKEIQHSLVIFCFADLALFTITHASWNPNSFASRWITSCATGYYLVPIRLFGISIFMMGLYGITNVSSRTATVAAILGACSAAAFGVKSFSKPLILACLIFAGIIVATLADPIQKEIRKLAFNSLDSDNSIAVFFLNDKRKKDLRADGDYFDRKRLWTRAIKTIKRNPLLGVGLGNEAKSIDDSTQKRAHNAWLSLAVEGGIPNAILWALLYAHLGYLAVFQVHTDSSAKLANLFVFLLTYILLSSMMESSGVGSVQAPNNLICLFLGSQMSQTN